ncbi:MAG: hypothetical protein QNJ57_03655 [Flavobacteriaceae bacterium]|nr:hypothetical protein [Flavobacteriaceae bacterium]
MEIFNLRNVNGRNKRRKQSKDGRFIKDHLSAANKPTEYNVPEVSSQKLERIKQDIRTKTKNQNRKEIILTILISSVILYLLYYLFKN